jgi:predicted Zn-dependent peptidase
MANLVASLLTKGTPNFSWSDIAEQIESVGASCGADAAADYFLLSL